MRERGFVEPAMNGPVEQLVSCLSPGTVVTDPAIVANYRFDWARDPSAGVPAAVVRARSTADVQTVLRWASENRVPVVPRGAGSSLAGGASGVEGGVTLSLELMRDVSVDVGNRVAVAQAGAITADVKTAAAAHGLWYPPDPSSYEMSSIGGNAATNAGGLCCLKYGVTGDYVLGMEVVLADGRIIRLGGPRLKDVAGLPLLRLFVGSEGTLGVITELTLRLLPPPPAPATLTATFGSVEAAAEAVVAITRQVRPAMLELMDRVAINAVEDLIRMDLDRSSEALLLARSDAPGAAAADELAIIEAACQASGAREVYTTTEQDEGDAFIHARRSALPAMERLGVLLIEDVGVPVPALPELVRGIRGIAEARNTIISVIAHAGDGNTHPVIAYPPGDDEAEARARLAFGDVMMLAIELGGTITGEHGVGRLKTPWLLDQLGHDSMALTRQIKDALDPAHILNPGVMLPEEPSA
ncbi:FAD-linked oxidase C-terminal domain-containing protein [Acrocarpospora macrocephala]|uniref:FAD-linked oxidase n=1 Tax=Acrocarpospora macrocephala TaxID=150177 RepID=A0A5M3WL91_9ACTN|nr:FAD-linked oxidase C-terminal domain-containing protein [Acrocarpospora macrocephala]GES09654.1 FAD-linked oxidase [Acrocarpospora macrocephala]